MKNRFNKFGFSKIKEGSSLIVAILIMGILLTLTLGLSNLVIREIRQTSDIVASGEAYYAAEAGIENAMYELAQGAPGYQTEGEDGWVVVDEPDLNYQYKIDNQGDSIPYFPEDEPIFLSAGDGVAAYTKSSVYQNNPELTYNVLPLNQTVTIPLFTEDGDVESFMVQYYVDFTLSKDYDYVTPSGQPISLQYFDILRWKVFGNPDADSDGIPDVDLATKVIETDAISDYYPANDGDGPEMPVCIGSSLLSDTFNGVSYTCSYPVAKYTNSDTQTVDDEEFGASWSSARECYTSEAGQSVAPLVGDSKNSVQKGCSISTFIGSHTRNYITLTNVVNPDIIGIEPDVRPELANIYYRVIAKQGPSEPKLVREFADISADGFARSGTFKQSIDVKLGLTSFLPVFNFSLYRTDINSDKETPDGRNDDI